MTPKGGKRTGAGRPARPNAIRKNVMLDKWAWDRLGKPGTFSEGIVRLIMNEMEPNEKLNAAHLRMDELGFSEGQQDFIFADWPNWDEHIDWLLTASKKDIEDWIKAGQ